MLESRLFFVSEKPPIAQVTKASTLGGKQFHRFYGGLHLTPNGVYAVFIESYVTYLYSR